jgi:hypothetical protein
MSDHLIVPSDHGRQLVLLPDQPAAIALLWRLEDKAQAGIVALVLDTVQSPAFALKAHPAGLARTDAVEGVIGTAGQRLGQHGIQVLGQPRDAQLPRQLVKGVLGKAVALPQGRKGGVSLLLLGAGDGTGCPAWAGSARMRRKRCCPSESTAL